MPDSSLRTRALALTGAFIALITAFLLLARPWYLSWGATEYERRRTLPGDEIVANEARQETRAITINAPVSGVWPWVAQLGQDRGGFYSYDVLENIVGSNMPTEDYLRPDRQNWQPGDKLWMYPPTGAGGAGFATLRTYIPGRALGFATRATGTSLAEPEDGSWSFIVEPVGEFSTRFLIRGRGAPGRSLPGAAFDVAIFEPMHFVMERRTMIGIKQLAETGERDRLGNHLDVIIWTVVFAMFVTAMILVLRLNEWQRPLLGFVAAGIVFQILTFVQPPLAMSLFLTAALLPLVWPGRRRPPHDAAALVSEFSRTRRTRLFRPV